MPEVAVVLATVVFVVMIGALGSAAVGLPIAEDLALAAAFVGAGLLLLGAVLLAAETYIGIGAIDGRIRRLIRRCSP